MLSGKLTRKFKKPVPFPVSLPDNASTRSSLYSDADLTAKDFDPALMVENPTLDPRPPSRANSVSRHFSRWRTGSSKFLGWPAGVIAGQLLIQGLGWGFFFAVQARGQVPLPAGAQWVKNNGHLVTLLVTLLSTMISACSSFFFSTAIRRSMSLYLYRPMSLGALGGSVSISMRSVAFHRRNWKWPTLSLLVFFLTGVQTSSWSMLLTPVTIIVSTPLLGSEIDLSSPTLHKMRVSHELSYCIFDDTTNSSMYTVQTDSGYAAAKASLKTASTFTLMDQVFNVSTAGILPAYLNSIDAGAWFTNKSIIPATTHNVLPLPKEGFSTNYSVSQQGFTADVSCSFRNLTNTTTPNLYHYTTEVRRHGWEEDLGIRYWAGTMTYSEIDTDCPMPNNLNWTYTFTDEGRTSMMLVPCQAQKSDNYTVIIATQGGYDWLPTTVCSVAPKIISVRVDYTSIANVTIVSSAMAIPDLDGPTGLSAMNSVANMVWMSQATETNVVGDHLSTLKAESTLSNDDMLRPLEAYIQGVVEYTGSVFRACLASNDTLQDLRANITIPTHGIFHTETLGWTYSDQFDPSDPLHLMAAAAAGGLNNAFRGLSGKDIKEGEKLNVVLSSIPGRGTALVRADQYRPVFSDAFSPRSAAYDEAE
ncbi:hypothetical protein DFH06DRAFT_1239410 [Mycena polygramma]|nr:hypothetical protein DFH06DRAFT_1239410 [Mycena polygramma]